MKPGKHQRSKHRCLDLCWKVHDRAQSFVLPSYTTHELRKPTRFYWLVPQHEVAARKENKNIQQRTLTSFITISLY